MNLEPPNLGVPLYRRDRTKLWLPVLAGTAAWLVHRPDNLPDSAISFFVGGAFLWFVFASVVSYRIANHKNSLVGGLWLVGALLGTSGFLRHVVPYLHGLV